MNIIKSYLNQLNKTNNFSEKQLSILLKSLDNLESMEYITKRTVKKLEKEFKPDEFESVKKYFKIINNYIRDLRTTALVATNKGIQKIVNILKTKYLMSTEEIHSELKNKISLDLLQHKVLLDELKRYE